jgi:signal peptidase I
MSDQNATPESLSVNPPEINAVNTADMNASNAGQVNLLLFISILIARVVTSFVVSASIISFAPAVLPGWHANVITGNSMYPKMEKGDVVLSQARDEYKIGQVVVFQGDQGRTTHRLIETRGTKWVTKGDSNPTPDNNLITNSDIEGVGRILVRAVGHPWMWYKERNWLPLTVFLLTLVGSAVIISKDEPEWYETHNNNPEDDDKNNEDNFGNFLNCTEHDDPPRGGLKKKHNTHSSPTHKKINRTWKQLTPTMLGSVLALSVGTVAPTMAAFTSTTDNPNNTWAAYPRFMYSEMILQDDPYLYLRLQETNPTSDPQYLTAADSSANNYTMQYARTTGSGVTFANSFQLGNTGLPGLTSTPLNATILRNGACIVPDGATTGPQPTIPSGSSPDTFTVEAWIRTTNNTQGGKIVGYESSRAAGGISTTYDRHLYMDTAGYVRFGVYQGSATKTIRSNNVLNDGQWHHVMGTLPTVNGTMRLYVDGMENGTPIANVNPANAAGSFRVGCGYLSGWNAAADWTGGNTPGLFSTRTFIGDIDEAVVYLKGLTAADAERHWLLGKRP